MVSSNCRVFIVHLAAVISATLPAFAQVRDWDEEKKLVESEARRAQALVRTLGDVAAGERSYDVTYYKLDIRVETAPTSISGAVTIRAFSRSATLQSATLDLVNAMTIDSVLVDGFRTSATQNPLTVDIDLGAVKPDGSAFTMAVYYHGIPSTSGFGSFAATTTPGGAPWIWTLSEPYGARDWWPCNDHPSDKADSLDVWITVPAALKAGSQGILEEVLSNSDGTKTYRWKHRYPISTYLVSLAISDYSEFSVWFKYSPIDSMEVLNYLLPGTSVGALPLTVNMLEIFSELFGPYPFLNEKYGHAQFGWGGAMEHQTMTSTGSTSEAIIAHELAHQWFGDMITLKTWPHIWLNEGFATYGQILYEERQYGQAAYASEIAYRMPLAATATTSLYVSDTSNIGLLFSSALVYSKGAMVLHMLRHVVGDSLFFAALKAYASDPHLMYGTATTEDLQGIFETTTGKDLGYFFSEWVYGQSYPQYTYSWGSSPSGGGHQVVVEITQATGTPNPTFFTMPVDLKIVGLTSDTTVVVFNDLSPQTFVVAVPFAPTNVILDPGSWILKEATGIQVAVKDGQIVPVRYELDQNFPNPFNPATTIRFGLAVRSRVQLEVFDVVGRRIATLVDDIRGAGFYAEVWSAQVPSGTYFYRVQATPVDAASEGYTATRAMTVIH